MSKLMEGVGKLQKRFSPLISLIVILVYVTIQSFGVSNYLFPADDGAEFAFVNGMDSSWQLLESDVFGLFRPVKNILFYVFARLMPDVWSCHLLSILIGVLSFFPVVAFFRRSLGREIPAVLAVGIWLLSPTLVSSVAWLSCVNIQLMCGFAAAVFVFHDKGTLRGRVLAGLFLFLALVSYEEAVVIGPIVVAFDFCLRADRMRIRKTWMAYCAYAVITLVYLLIRHAIGSGTAVSGSFDSVSRLQMMMASAYFTWQHFVSWLWPFGRFAVFGGYRVGDASIWVLSGCWIGVFAMVTLSFLLRKTAPLVAFGLMLSLLGFVPVSNLAGLGNGPYGDYYLGLASMGFALIVVDVVRMLFDLRANWRIAGVAFSVLVIGWRVCAVAEAAHWAALWGGGVSAYTESAQNFDKFFGNLQKLAEIYCNAEDWKGVRRTCDKLESMLSPQSPQRTIMYHVLALQAMIRDKDANATLEFIEKAKSVSHSESFDRHYHYVKGCVFEDLENDTIRAFEEYSLSLAGQFDFDSVDMANRLARLLALDGQLNEAIVLWEKALRIKPDSFQVLVNLKRAYELRGQQDKRKVR